MIKKILYQLRQNVETNKNIFMFSYFLTIIRAFNQICDGRRSRSRSPVSEYAR